MPLVDRFFLRETRVKELASQEASPINPEPFKPYKSPTSGRWLPPRLSLRRQAQLGKEAYKNGQFEELTKFIQENGRLESVKLGKMKARIEELAVEAEKVPGKGSEASTSSVVKGEKRTAREEGIRALRLARALAATRGPYAGRSLQRVFKGTRAERFAAPKKQATKEKMSTMDKTVEAWRKVSQSMGVILSWRACLLLQVLTDSSNPFSQEQRQRTRLDHQCHSRRIKCVSLL